MNFPNKLHQSTTPRMRPTAGQPAHRTDSLYDNQPDYDYRSSRTSSTTSSSKRRSETREKHTVDSLVQEIDQYIAEQEVQEIREDFIKVLIRADIFDAVEYALVQRANTDVEIYRKSLYPVFSYPLFGISHAK